MERMTSINALVKLAQESAGDRHWYANAEREIVQAARMLNTSPRRLADMLALFSPRVSVRRSIRMALRYLESRTFTHDCMVSVRRAVDHYEHSGRIRGIKTGPFAEALLGDPDAIVLDVWMARAFRIEQTAFNRRPVHAECCRRIRLAAKRLGWTYAETQAAIWHTVVRQYGKRPGRLVLIDDTLWGSELIAAA